MRLRIVFLGFLLIVLTSNVAALDIAEPFCPGGSNPRSDISWCANFENFNDADCQNNLRSCWQNLGFNDDWPGTWVEPDDYLEPDRKKVIAGETPVGQGLTLGNGLVGGSGYGGYAKKTNIGSHLAANLRYYIKFSEDFVSYNFHHSSGIIGSGNSCGVGGTFETSQYNYNQYSWNTCGPSFPSNALGANVNPIVMKNNKWYVIEIQRIADNFCTDSSDPFGCNGVERVWIDNQLVMEYTNLNYGGELKDLKWSGIWGPRDYWHARTPPWPTSVSYDAYVFSNANPRDDPNAPCVNNMCIGRSSIEDPSKIGNPIQSSPYYLNVGIEPFYGRHIASDCTGPGSWGASGGRWYPEWGGDPWWEDNGTGWPLVEEVFYPNGLQPHEECLEAVASGSIPSNAYNEKSFKVELTQTNSRGGGFFFTKNNGYGGHQFPTQVIHGRIFFPSGNDYSTNPPLVGHISYKCANDCSGAEYGRYLALTIDNGKFAMVERPNGAGTLQSLLTTSNVLMQENTWHEFEIILYTDTDEVSLMIDKQIVIPKTRHNLETNWKPGKHVFGVIDFQGTPIFNVYYDELQVGGISFWSCEGWGTSCPFGSGNSDTQSPSITIDSPTSNPNYDSPSQTVSLSGTASDNTGITIVSWVNNRGGTGNATGTTNWNISNISLQDGDNLITVTAWDTAGNFSTDSITVTFSDVIISCPVGSSCITNNCPGVCDSDETTCNDIPNDNCPVIPPTIPPTCEDKDLDGFEDYLCGGMDCNDSNPNVNPNGIEICGDRIDQNCNGSDEICTNLCGNSFCDELETQNSCPSDCFPEISNPFPDTNKEKIIITKTETASFFDQLISQLQDQPLIETIIILFITALVLFVVSIEKGRKQTIKEEFWKPKN